MKLYCSIYFISFFVALTTISVNGFVIPIQRSLDTTTQITLKNTRRRRIPLLSPLYISTIPSQEEKEQQKELQRQQKELTGDDSAYFSFQDESILDWMKFTLATGFVLITLSYAWFLPDGPHWGNTFLETTQDVIGTKDPAPTMFALLTVFAVSHSGLAGLRTYAEDVVGPRAWRVLFACVSLPLALSCMSYFVNHAHDGHHLWNVQHTHALHTMLYIINFVSFLFLYPSTFNFLEVAAVDVPKVHLWETGVIRITRHPQAIGQILWCAAHGTYLGTDTALTACFVLVVHHLYSIWHGDRRLRQEHGDAFDVICERTSIVPFAAILDGRQRLPDDFYKEFMRLPYALVIGGTMAAYYAHPYMQIAAASLKW